MRRLSLSLRQLYAGPRREWASWSSRIEIKDRGVNDFLIWRLVCKVWNAQVIFFVVLSMTIDMSMPDQTTATAETELNVEPSTFNTDLAISVRKVSKMYPLYTDPL